jgi:UDP-N-acetylmuramate dehydrogenase
MIEACFNDLSIQRSVDLKPFNSLAVAAIADYFCTVENLTQLKSALSFASDNNLKVTPLGGGSNVVLAADISGLVVHINLTGVTSQSVSNDQVDVHFAAGENWHEMVELCLKSGWYGIENLALIPGYMGAAPIQNIGAYGVELSDVLQSVDVFEVKTAEVKTLYAADCQFGYRTSVFKQSAKDQFIITSVCLRLSTVPKVNVEYPSLKASFENPKPTPEDVFQAVCKIRSSKLPDPIEIPNVGSFFKNPIISQVIANKLVIEHPELPVYPYSESSCKVPAAWLIEHCGFKGCRRGDVGVHDKQALVLVNYGGEGSAILALAEEISAQVLQEFAIQLETEPRIYGDPS